MHILQLTIDGLLIILLVTVAYSDFKYRHVLLWQFLAIGGIFLINALMYISFLDFMRNWAINIGIVLIQLLIVQAWFVLRDKKNRNIVNKMIGMGDILFFVLLAMYFETYSFVLFVTGTLLIISIIYLFRKIFSSDGLESIPLAGWWALMLLPFFPLKYFLHLNHYFNTWLYLP